MNKIKGCLGITNKTQDNKFIPFIDYDNIPLDLVVKEIHDIQNIFKLGCGFVISTTNGFNVFFLDKLSYKDCIDILKYSSCDLNYLRFSVEKNNMTIRLGNDKNFVFCISSDFNKNVLSSAHYNLFNMVFDRDIFFSPYFDYKKNLYDFDNLSDFSFVIMGSKKYGFIDMDRLIK